MPTLVRFFIVLVVIAAAVFAGMVYLGNFVTPNSREMTVRIPSDRLKPVPIVPPPMPATAAAPAADAAAAPASADDADGVQTVETPE